MGRYSNHPDRPLWSIRRRSTAALPEEILLAIFELVEGPPQEASCRERTDGRVPGEVLAIQNLRLTSRQFNRIASPLLMPTVPVDYRYSSIKRLEQVSSHPLISSGVRTVAVMLQGLVGELAWTTSCFFEEMKETLRAVFRDVCESSTDRLALDHPKIGFRDPATRCSIELDPGLLHLLFTLETTFKDENSLDRIRDLKRVQFCNLEDAIEAVELMMPPDGVKVTRRKHKQRKAAYHYNPERYTEQRRLVQTVILRDIKNLQHVYQDLYQNQQQLMAPSDERGGLSEFSALVASAMAKMSGQRPRSIDFISEVPPCRSLKHLVPPKSFAGWEGWYETLAVNISRTAMKHHPTSFRFPVDHMTVARVPAALKAANVQFNLDQMSVKLSGANMRPWDGSVAPLLLDALPFLRPRSFLFDGTGSKVHGSTEDPHNQFFAICLLQPSLRRVEFHRRSCFEDGRDWLKARLAPISERRRKYEPWCTRVRIEEPPPHLYSDDDVIPVDTVGGQITSLNISGGMFKQRDLFAVMHHIPADMDGISLSDVLLISPNMADTIPDLGGLLREINKCPTCEDHDTAWIREMQENLSGFLVAETLQWEKVLDVLREGKNFGRGKKEASSLPSPLRLRALDIGKVILMKRYKLYYLINAFAKVWVPNQRRRTEGNDGGDFLGRLMWNCECQSSWAEVDKEHVEAVMSEEMNAAEEYVMHLRDGNPVTEFRVNLLLLSRSEDQEDKEDKDDENDDDGDENEDEQQDENQDQDEDEDEDEDVEDEDAEDEDTEDEGAEDEDKDEENDDDDRVYIAGVYIGTRQELV